MFSPIWLGIVVTWNELGMESIWFLKQVTSREVIFPNENKIYKRNVAINRT